MLSMYVLVVRINKKYIKIISWEKNFKNYFRFCKFLEINELDIIEIEISVKLRFKILIL